MALSDPPGIALEVVREADALVGAADLAAFRTPDPPPPGLWLEAAAQIADPLGQTALAKTGDALGAPLPDWTQAARCRIQAATIVCRVRDAHVSPVFGAVIGPGGKVMRATVGEMLSWRPDLAVLPHTTRAGEIVRFAPPDTLPARDAATVWMAWGGAFNYGHFLLDCLPSLLAVQELGLTDQAPPICAPLKRWSGDLLALAFPDLKVIELRAPMLRVGEAVFATSLDHFLHHPNALLARLRARILAASPPPRRGRRRLYLSRRGHPMRVMVNEAELERALRRRGFQVVRCERLSVAAQIALMREAELVVGPSGAALANALFTEPGARVIEIQPQTFTSHWMDMLCHVIGRRWTGYFCPAPAPASEVSLAYRVRRGFGFGYRLPLDAFLGVIDAAIAGEG